MMVPVSSSFSSAVTLHHQPSWTTSPAAVVANKRTRQQRRNGTGVFAAAVSRRRGTLSSREIASIRRSLAPRSLVSMRVSTDAADASPSSPSSSSSSSSSSSDTPGKKKVTEKPDGSVVFCFDPDVVDDGEDITVREQNDHDDDGNSYVVTVDPSSGIIDIYADIFDADGAEMENAAEVLRSPNGDIMFRFTGDVDEDEGVDDEAGNEAYEPTTPAKEAQALLDEAQRLIDRAKAIESEEEEKKKENKKIAEAARLAAEAEVAKAAKKSAAAAAAAGQGTKRAADEDDVLQGDEKEKGVAKEVEPEVGVSATSEENGEKTYAAASAEADQGTIIRRREKKGGGGTGAAGRGSLGMETVSKLGIKSIVDGIENMFETLKNAAASQAGEDKPGKVRLPEAPRDSPWAEGHVPPIAPDVVGAAFDSFGGSQSGVDNQQRQSGEDEGGEGREEASAELWAVEAAGSVEAGLAEMVETEHAEWEEAAQHALEEGNLEELNTPLPPLPSDADEDADEGEDQGEGEGKRASEGDAASTALAAPSAQTLYDTMGTMVSGLWRPKPIDVNIKGHRYIAYVTPRKLRQLPSGEMVVGGGPEDGDGDGDEDDKPGDSSTIIMCEPMEDGSSVFMFGLTRTVLPDGSVLYRFPGGRELGRNE